MTRLTRSTRSTRCVVCRETIESPIYQSPEDVSITSLSEVRSGRTVVWFCDGCGHLQTDPLDDLAGYYDSEYEFLTDSDDEDQVLEIRGGTTIYRNAFQAETLLRLVDLPRDARVLDYGCAKASTLRRICEARPDVVPHLFDVSDRYTSFWRRFSSVEHWCTHEVDPAWNARFDLVTSFFALEHVADPIAMLRTVRDLVRPGGCFYCVVPDVYTNDADLIVADHVNHFSAASIRRLFTGCGFTAPAVDETTHRGALIAIASTSESCEAAPVERGEIDQLRGQAERMAAAWTDLADRVRHFERSTIDEPKIAIYGSGFYGTAIASCLEDRSRVACFVDRNPYLQGKKRLDRPVVGPGELDGEVSTVLVGLNPRIARRAIGEVAEWSDRRHTYFYL